MSIPALDMKAPYRELKAELDAAYFRFMESGWYVLGEETRLLEAEYAAYCCAHPPVPELPTGQKPA